MQDENESHTSSAGDINPLAYRKLEVDLDLYELSLSDAAFVATSAKALLTLC